MSLWLLFSCSVVSNSLWPHGLQWARLSCPSPSERAYSNSCPLSQWCHPTISVVPFSSCCQSFPESGAFPMNQFFTWWPKYWSFSFSISPSNEYSGLISFRIDWFDPLAVQGTLKRFFQHHSSKALILRCSVLFMVQLSHQPTLVLLPGKCHGWRNLVGYRSWYLKESDTTEWLHSLTLTSK